MFLITWRKNNHITQGTFGFTLIELLIVIAIIGIVATQVFSSVNEARKSAQLSSARSELDNIVQALELYLLNNNWVYPDDVSRDIPPGLEKYLGPGDWPQAPWPGSVYDWDAYESNGEQVYQISIRFCELNKPSTCNFPDESWAEDFDYYSSVYYCIQGPCKAHPSKPADHPGRCVNCGN